jgi:hypothetical protein
MIVGWWKCVESWRLEDYNCCVSILRQNSLSYQLRKEEMGNGSPPVMSTYWMALTARLGLQ